VKGFSSVSELPINRIVPSLVGEGRDVDRVEDSAGDGAIQRKCRCQPGNPSLQILLSLPSVTELTETELPK